jgi:virulence-associated protein VapD
LFDFDLIRWPYQTQKSNYNESTMQLYEDQLKKLNKSIFEEKQTVVELNNKLEMSI